MSRVSYSDYEAFNYYGIFAGANRSFKGFFEGRS